MLKNAIPKLPTVQNVSGEDRNQRHPVIESETQTPNTDPISNLPNIDQLEKKCMKVCLKSNSVKTCQFLCDPISTLKELTQTESAKEEAITQAKEIIEQIKALSTSVTLPTDIPIPNFITGQGREEGAPPMPTEIPVGP